MKTPHIYIIGAGAAGCFAAIALKREYPTCRITILERGKKPLAKVAITGGGRCNLTNSFADITELSYAYPRGFRLLKRLFHEFSPAHTQQWFEDEGVPLVTQEDGCVFPRSQQAMDIVHTLLHLIKQLDIRIITEAEVLSITKKKNQYLLYTASQEFVADGVLVAIGGSAKEKNYQMLQQLGLRIQLPIASLFSFYIPHKPLLAHMGTVIENVCVGIPSTKHQAKGPLLITHWGVSGPAILKLSSYAARYLSEKKYLENIYIRWVGELHQEEVIGVLEEMSQEYKQKMITSVRFPNISSGLWEYLVERAQIKPTTRWSELRGKLLHRLAQILTNDTYAMEGKNRFKEEFVTCGGVDLSELNTRTLEAKAFPGLFFAGEITDVDAITGGFNLQAAWSMGYVAAQGMAAYMASWTTNLPIN